MTHLYQSDFQAILRGLETLAIAEGGGTKELLELIKKIKYMLKEEQDRVNRDY